MLERRLARENVELSTYRERVSERQPCATLSPTAASEDHLQAVRSEQAQATILQLREVEYGLQRLLKAPEQFGRCVRCEHTIPAARLEVLPFTTLCARCARGDSAPAERQSAST